MANEVDTQHDDYQSALPDWTRVEDACAGERAIKCKEDAYLPRPNPKDKSNENRARYEQYLCRAVYMNATGRTASSLVGMAFRDWPEIKVPDAVNPLLEDATGSGIPLIQHARTSLQQVLQTGRAGLLVDYPAVEGTISKADQDSGGVQPTLTHYPATAVINWRTVKANSKVRLSMVVLLETYQEAVEFGTSSEPQYRVLSLVDGLYTVYLWRKVAAKNASGTEIKQWQIVQKLNPVQGNGRPWDEIPFTFIGSQNNDSSVDPAPMLDLANVNIAHYRNSADYEDSVYFCGQPMFYVAGLTEKWRDHMEKQGLYVGSRAVLPLPQGASAGILQAQPNTLAKEAMAQKEDQMAALGARLMLAVGGTKTATQQDSEDAAAHSVLTLCCDNVSLAYKQALQWAAQFAGAKGEVVFSIPTEFVSTALDSVTLQALLAMVQAGKLPDSDFWTVLRNAGYIDSEKTNDEVREEINSQEPTVNPLAEAAAAAAAANPPTKPTKPKVTPTSGSKTGNQ